MYMLLLYSISILSVAKHVISTMVFSFSIELSNSISITHSTLIVRFLFSFSGLLSLHLLLSMTTASHCMLRPLITGGNSRQTLSL